MTGKLTRRQALLLGGGAVAALASAGTATAAGAWIRLPVVTANIGRDNLGAREAAIRDVRNADPGNRPFVGWQEIREGDDGEPAIISQYFGDLYQNAFLHHESSYRVPISVPQPWTVINSRATFVHGGMQNITPPRWINEVVVQHTADPALVFTLIDSHYIYGAYNGPQEVSRRDEWDLHKQRHRERVMAHHNNGRLVIWTADTNNPNYGNATGQAGERKAFAGGIDRINWLPGDGSVELELLSTKVIPMHVDGHDARAAIFRIRSV
ncbi:hypothetical protein ACFCV3_08150 [Kribbella sp. NPDC056345]|uniref:hypothetical protein n=1 Tax=Kribbella sp. NPDC056345 TaxID=3345789 RepID=UPI0035D7E9D7